MEPKRDPIQVLVVEDSPCDLALLKRALKRSPIPYTLFVAETGEQALEMLSHQAECSQPPVQFVLLDWHLPRMHGRDVLNAIKDDQRMRHIPVVVFSSSDHPQDVEEAYRLHANCYVTKPIEWPDYLRAVDEVDHFWFKHARLPYA